jgi:hypothetical protein
MNEPQESFAELIATMRSLAQSQIRLAQAIELQAAAIADLAESVVHDEQIEEGPGEGLGHLGTI